MTADKDFLVFDGVSKVFESPDGHQVVALDDFSLTVGDGEFVTIVGPSGCGKSTLLNLLVGLDMPSKGEIRLAGRPSWKDRLNIGYVTQEDNLYPWRTLAQNVEFPLEIRGVARDERRKRSHQLLDRVGLTGFEDRYTHQLSGGMRQRGNIVRALTFGPRLLVMDEPFGPLDAQTRVILQEQLLELWSQDRKTVIFITHDLQEAIALGDRVVVMTARPGRIKAVHEVSVPRPRDLHHLHEHAEFRSILSELWDALAEEVALARAQEVA